MSTIAAIRCRDGVVVASDRARDAGIEAIVATHDEGGHAVLRSIFADGSTLSDAPMAVGHGTGLVLGALEAADTGSLSVSESETLLCDVFERAAERDPGTGGEVDVWTLEDR